MKVDLTGLPGSTLDAITSPQRTPSPTVANASNDDVGIGEDAATLSVDSARVSALVTKALDAPDIRQDKVEALRQAVQNGEYQVDPAQVAEAMIRQSD